MRGVEVRMTDHNRLEPALLVDEVDGRLVNVCDQVPENVSGIGLDEDRPLADPELLASCIGRRETGWVLCGLKGLGADVVDAWVMGVDLDGVFLEAGVVL